MESATGVSVQNHFSGSQGKVEKLHAVRIEFGPADATGRRPMNEVPGSEFEVKADLVLLALGFLGPEQNGMIQQLGLKLDARGNVAADKDYMTSIPASSQLEICGAANPWSCGPSLKAGSVPAE